MNDTAGGGWHLELKRFVFYKVASILFTALLVMAGVGEASEGRATPAVGMIILGLIFGMATMPLWLKQRRRPPRLHGTGSARGLLLPAHPPRIVFYVATGVLGTMLVATTAVLLTKGGELGVARQVAGAFFTLAPGSLMLFIAYTGIRTRRRTHSGLMLTGDAIVLRERRKPLVLPWASVSGVRTHWTRWADGGFTEDDLVQNWLSFTVRPDVEHQADVYTPLSSTSDPTVAVHRMAVDPYVMLEVVRFYIDHPEARNELGTHASLTRYNKIAQHRENAST